MTQVQPKKKKKKKKKKERKREEKEFIFILGIDRYTLLYIKLIGNKDLKESEKEWIYV